MPAVSARLLVSRHPLGHRILERRSDRGLRLRRLLVRIEEFIFACIGSGFPVHSVTPFGKYEWHLRLSTAGALVQGSGCRVLVLGARIDGVGGQPI